MRCKARRAFKYGDIELDEGQVFVLQGFRNDEKLLGLRFCEKVSVKLVALPCSACNGSAPAEFIDEEALRRHQAKRHSPSAPVLKGAVRKQGG